MPPRQCTGTMMADMVPGDSWESPEIARSYAAFARRYPMYQDTSRDLVSLARLAPGAHAVDLACGTGITTQAVLSVLGPSGRVVAVDASAAMLAIARSLVADGRVRWLRARAERLGGCSVGEGTAQAAARELREEAGIGASAAGRPGRPGVAADRRVQLRGHPLPAG